MHNLLNGVNPSSEDEQNRKPNILILWVASFPVFLWQLLFAICRQVRLWNRNISFNGSENWDKSLKIRENYFTFAMA